MRTDPYPVPPSRTWSLVMLLAYAAMAVAGGLVLLLLIILPQPVEGVLVLGLWGGLTFPAALACMYGVLRGRYRFEWMGTWFLVMGTSVYLVQTFLGLLGTGALLSSLPTVLVFAYAIGLTLGRAVQLSLIDLQARKRVLIERAVQEVARSE